MEQSVWIFDLQGEWNEGISKCLFGGQKLQI